METRFYWHDDALAQARALAQWTNLRHRVKRDGDAWLVELVVEAAPLIEVCS